MEKTSIGGKGVTLEGCVKLKDVTILGCENIKFSKFSSIEGVEFEGMNDIHIHGDGRITKLESDID